MSRCSDINSTSFFFFFFPFVFSWTESEVIGVEWWWGSKSGGSRREEKSESHSVVSDSYSPWNFPGQNTGVGRLSLLQGIFPTQGSNLGLPHCRRILYQLSHQGSPRILKWVAYPFSRGSYQPRNRTRVSCIAGGLFTNWAIREACIVHQKNYGILFFISFLNDKFLILYTITLEINVQYEWLYKK